MTYNKLISEIKKKKTFLCIGLDTDKSLIPAHLNKYSSSCLEFNKQIIESTVEYVIAYKINTAFYEEQGENGWKILKETIYYIKKNFPDIFIIADAKRGDISNTAEKYAKAFFEYLNCDAITLSPYMGLDTIEPYLKYKNKFVIILALTSNPGANDFQILRINNQALFEIIIKKTSQLASKENLMYVIGATKASLLVNVRELVPENFLLIPGIGKQGGDLNEVFKYGKNKNCGLIVNSSRNIIYASSDINFNIEAANKAKEIQQKMANLLNQIF